MKINSCFYHYGLNIVFFIGIILYTIQLYIDIRDNKDNKDNRSRSNSEEIWIWGLYILLIIGFIISSCHKS